KQNGYQDLRRYQTAWQGVDQARQARLSGGGDSVFPVNLADQRHLAGHLPHPDVLSLVYRRKGGSMMVKRKRSNLALLAAGAGGAAVAGFGLALGKDVYKKSKKNLGLILVLLVVLFFPFFGGRELVRGHDRGLF